MKNVDRGKNVEHYEERLIKAIEIDREFLLDCEYKYNDDDITNVQNELELYEAILGLPKPEKNFILFDLYEEGNCKDKAERYGIGYSSYRVYACEIKKKIKNKILYGDYDFKDTDDTDNIGTGD